MGVPGNANALLLVQAAAAGGYTIDRSLRFNSADSAYLNRTPASAGNRRVFTFSCWVKLTASATYRTLIRADANGAGFARINDNHTISFGGWGGEYATSAVFRDYSAWYHLLFSVDTTQGTASNRVKIYVNGSEQVKNTVASDVSQNYDFGINSAAAHRIGSNLSNAELFDGYLADVHFIDGQALDPTSFGEFDTNGVWQPLEYTGSYGTNGFHLDFADNSSAAALGYDAAGSNDWTVNNLSVTAGAGNDSLVDTPTSYGTDDPAGATVRGNYATLNALKKGSAATLSNGNLDVSCSTATSRHMSTIAVSSGKWYAEFTYTGTNISIGIAKATCSIDTGSGTTQYWGGSDDTWAYYSNGSKYTNNSGSSYGTSISNGDVIGIAFDADNGDLYFYRNGTVQNSGTAAFTGLTSGPYVFGAGESGLSGSWNFGSRPFAYTAPSGFKALCTTNLPTPTIEDGSTAMDVLVFAATNANNTSITGLNFQPDLVWGKSRTNAYSHQLYDSVRGVNKNLKSNTTGEEVTDTVGLTSFDSNGFTAGVDFNVILGSGSSVAWCWDAGSSTVTNNDGSITSSVRANASAGFSIVTYTGVGSTGTVGHGLGIAPSFYVVKARTTTSANSWRVYHSALGNTKQLFLEDTAAASTNSSAWNNTSPTSTVFSVGSLANESSGNYVAYCFAPVAGYSSMGSYVGNGSSNGVFVYTGHQIKFLLIKNTTLGGSNWRIIDTARNPYNVANLLLNPNSSNAEQTTTLNTIDLLSNGFKCRGTDGDTNSSGDTFIYCAFASHPFQTARAR